MTPYLSADIERDEGCKLTAYKDTLGIWTIGVGHAHVEPGTVWTQAQADDQLGKDIAAVCHGLDEDLPWWRSLDDARQDVLVNMAFNMGVNGLLTFRQALASIQVGDYARGAQAMLASRWAGQVGDRAKRLADQMRTGARA